MVPALNPRTQEAEAESSGLHSELQRNQSYNETFFFLSNFKMYHSLYKMIASDR